MAAAAKGWGFKVNPEVRPTPPRPGATFPPTYKSASERLGAVAAAPQMLLTLPDEVLELLSSYFLLMLLVCKMCAGCRRHVARRN